LVTPCVRLLASNECSVKGFVVGSWSLRLVFLLPLVAFWDNICWFNCAVAFQRVHPFHFPFPQMAGLGLLKVKGLLIGTEEQQLDGLAGLGLRAAHHGVVIRPGPINDSSTDTLFRQDSNNDSPTPEKPRLHSPFSPWHGNVTPKIPNPGLSLATFVCVLGPIPRVHVRRGCLPPAAQKKVAIYIFACAATPPSMVSPCWLPSPFVLILFQIYITLLQADC
jgi:hypothetical protein